MTFSESIKTCLNKYANFNGRASRSELWWFQLFYILVAFVASLINDDFFWLSYIALFLPLLAVCVRRLHDKNKSGWWYLMSFVPIANIVLLVWFCQRGTVGANNFGDDPLSEIAQ
jgi:uncharacterized membrane protein YhaH (DUF805 family)